MTGFDGSAPTGGPPNPYEGDPSPLDEFAKRAPQAPPAPGIYGSTPGGPAPLGQSPLPCPPAPVKTRRVGTVTMALCLIAVGTLMLLRIVVPSIDFIALLRFSPVVLVLFGAEVLLAGFLHKQEQLRYDGFSVFFSIVLIGASLFAASVPEFLHRKVESEQVARRLEAQLNQQSSELLAGKDFPGMATVYWTVDLHSSDFSADTQLADIPLESYIRLDFSFNKPYPSKEAFAQDTRQMLDLLVPLAPHLDYALVESSSQAPSPPDGFAFDYTLVLRGQNQMQAKAKDLLPPIETTYYIQENGHYNSMDEQDYLEWQGNTAASSVSNPGISQDGTSGQDAASSAAPKDNMAA